MIVKDEASSIERVLRNALPFMDQWAIYDTGSTDGTQDIIRKVAADFPNAVGVLEEGPFNDFSFARNKALSLARSAKPSPMYTLMLDGDWYIYDSNNEMRTFLDSKRSAADENGYLMRVNQGNFSLDYWSGRILRTDSGLVYEGVVHEVPNEVLELMLPATVMLNWTATEENQKQSNKRWERDLVLLQQEYARQPNNSRTVFYLAQTYGSLQMHEEAANMYAVRASMLDSWEEETFIAMYRRAEHLDWASHPWPEVLDLYLQAWEFRPQRAEPLYRIAKYYHDEDQMHLCGLFAVRAYGIPYPPNHSLFVYRSIYDYHIPDVAGICAWYSRDYEIGLKATSQLLLTHPKDARILRNHWYYLDHFDMAVPEEVSRAVAAPK